MARATISEMGKMADEIARLLPGRRVQFDPQGGGRLIVDDQRVSPYFAAKGAVRDFLAAYLAGLRAVYAVPNPKALVDQTRLAAERGGMMFAITAGKEGHEPVSDHSMLPLVKT
jgi:hypothetical protein